MNASLAAITQQLKHIAVSRQFWMFIGVGGSSTLLQLVLLLAFVEYLAIAKVIASAAAYLLSAVYNYCVNYYVTFASTKSHSQTLPKFIGVVFIGVTVNVIVFTVALLAVPYLIAQLIAVGVTLVVNFLLHKFWIYRSAT